MQKLILALGVTVSLTALANQPPSSNPSTPASTSPAAPEKAFDKIDTIDRIDGKGMKTKAKAGILTVFRMDMIEAWPVESRTAAQEMLEKYGSPDEVTETHLVWKDKGNFKKISVSSEPIDHQFPVPHKDVLMQVIEYKVPVDKIDDLAMFDGSLIVDRTKGTLASRCDNEGNNFAALNLADDIVKGKKTMRGARAALTKMANEVATDEGMLKDSLQFQVATTSTADPDRAMAVGK